MNYKTIVVIGAGIMGAGTAQNLAEYNYSVILIDLDEEALNKAKAEIEKDVRFQAFFKKNKNNSDPAKILSQIKFTTNIKELSAADFIIENVTEDWNIKKEVHKEIEKIVSKDVIVAVNTSAIPITQIASAYRKYPENVIGLHFMNPVPLKTTVEMIRGFYTSEETIKKTKEFLASFGKETVLVNDSPGFVSNRVLMLTINEAIFLLQEKVAEAADIDKIFKSCFGHKMGPLETADLIGLDTILHSIDILYENFKDSKYRASPLLRKMVNAGFYGRKNGKGFYNYKIE
jgi:3-hydroxybutyryl-CoA dehydrogenase